MPGIGIVTNPHSRRNRRFPEQMRRLGYILGRDDVHQPTNQLEDVQRVAEEFRDNAIDVLALNGGDGTNHVTLSTFIKVYGETPLPKVAFLRGGTMNTISEAVGVRGAPGAILLNLVEKYYTGQEFDTTFRDLLKITDDTGVRYGFIFGNGIAASFLEAYYETGNPSPPVAARLLIQALGSAIVGGPLSRRLFAGFKARIEMDSETWPEETYTAVLVGTIEQIGLGWRPFTRCEEREGAFHVAAVRASGMTVARQLPRLRLGQRADDAIIRDAVASRALFRSDREILYTIDGDMHRAHSEVLLEAGPRLEIILG